MYGVIISELRSFYIHNDAEDLWEESIGNNIDHDKIYNDSVFKNLIHLLAVRSNQDFGEILRRFGEFITPFLLKLFPINTDRDIIELLSNIDNEVAPFRNEIQSVDASPFNVVNHEEGKVEMLYSSRKDMPELRIGMIIGLAKQMNENIKVDMTRNPAGETLITITKVNSI